MDIRLPTMPFDFNGKKYTLCCNMNVLADVQEAYNGNLMAALRNPSNIKASTTFLAAMLNDCAESNGWAERYTARQVGRLLAGNPESVKLMKEIGGFVRKSMTVKPAEPDAGQEANEKNVLTTQNR